MKALITGGAGFIGSYLAEELLKRNYHVWVIDDLSTGRIENIDALKSNNKFNYIIDTIMNKNLMAELVDRSSVIFHLAAAVGVQLIVDQPVKTIETNIKGTEVVLELAEKKQKKVVIASTSEIYGKSSQIPFTENGDMLFGPTIRSRWSYAVSKAIDEFLGLAYYYEKKLPVAITRLFNTVGPRQTGRYGMVIPRFIKQALNNESLTVYGDGNQSRCFTYVGDVVTAIADVSELKEAFGQVYNIGSTEEITIKDLAEKIIKMTGSKSKIEFIPYEKAYSSGFEDMNRRIPDISKIGKLTGYKPSVNLEEILKRTIEYMRNAD
ncbi:MAG: GDP-mannose 4,6-dehydratase [Acidobacteria bacterium]|nr:GDP-mannose 4,6-dehydratase [Acidobacteriota bacterium]